MLTSIHSFGWVISRKVDLRSCLYVSWDPAVEYCGNALSGACCNGFMGLIGA